jgi:asparagine synthase (glutamine-hydrolysing)
MIPMFFLAELASKYVKVVLTGQGADEPLGGYTRYKSELLQEKIPGFVQRLVGNMTAGRNIRHEKIQRGIGTLGISDDIERFLAVYQVFQPAEIKAMINTTDLRSNASLRYFYDSLDCAKKIHSVERMMVMDTRLNLSDDLLNYTDKITMRFSIECRVPMLDLDLVKYIESLPLPMKVNLRSGKLIHKQFAQRILPDRIIDRPKKSFQSPTQLWFRSGAEQIRELLLQKDTPFSSIFAREAVGRIIDQHQEGFNREKQIFLLLSIYFWLESAAHKTS